MSSPSQDPSQTPPKLAKNLTSDQEQDEHTQPGIPRPGQQPDQQQQPFAPPQSGGPSSRSSGTQIIPPSYGNPDLDPAGMTARQPIDLREPNPHVPQGMIYDPRQLLDHQRRQGPQHPNIHVPPGARYDPFGPPDPSQVGPGRGPNPDLRYGQPDPDHFQPPGVAQIPRGKTLKSPWPPGGMEGPGGGFPPPGGSGGSPFM